ncbi:3409_t:CDS:1, partial [Gigaspora rosea]
RNSRVRGFYEWLYHQTCTKKKDEKNKRQHNDENETTSDYSSISLQLKIW